MRYFRPILSAAAVLSLAACGSQAGSTSGSEPPVFPLTLTRTGGIAGFHDELLVASDGLVSVTQKGKPRQQCRLTPQATKKVTAAAARVPWADLNAASTSASFPDDLVTMVESKAGGPVRLEYPQIGAAGTTFQELLDDLTTGRSASGRCTPV